MPSLSCAPITLNLLRDGHLRWLLEKGAQLLGFSVVTLLSVQALGPSVASAQQAAYSHGNPSSLEQYMLELINRARLNPTREGILLDSLNTWYSRDARSRKPSFFANLRGEFASYPAVAPVAFHPALIRAAATHSQDMINRNYMAHVNPEGQTPTTRAAAAGYDSGAGENIDGGGATSADEILRSHFSLMVDYDNADSSSPLGHRRNVLTSSYTEVGVGVRGVLYAGRITQDFGSPARSYILGVAYTDSNGNGMYDPGEGLSGVTVRPDSGNWYAITSLSGGFAIPVDPIETVTDSVTLPFAVQGAAWTQVQPYDLAYRQQQIQNAPTLSVQLTWSGGALASPRVTTVAMKRPVRRNYRLTGTDGWNYSQSMVTAQNSKADLKAGSNVKSLASRRDFNADGSADLLFQNTSGQVVAWYMNGGGSLSSTTWIWTAALPDWKVVQTADLNNDGRPDILFQNSAGQIAVWYMGANGTISSGANLYNGVLGDWKIVGSADLNGDGNADLIFQNVTGQIVAWYMNGSGGIISGAFLYTGGLGDWKIAGLADINSDGNADLIFQNTAGQIVVWYLNGSGGTFASAYLYTGGLGDWRIAGLTDMNNDGKADLIFQNTIGQIAVWYMNGSGGALSSAFLYSGALSGWQVR